MELQKKHGEAEWPIFKAWIEQTALFHALVNDIGGTIRLYDEDGDVTGEFARNGVRIRIAEDLPVEVLEEFYINSPFYIDPTESW